LLINQIFVDNINAKKTLKKSPIISEVEVFTIIRATNRISANALSLKTKITFEKELK